MAVCWLSARTCSLLPRFCTGRALVYPEPRRARRCRPFLLSAAALLFVKDAQVFGDFCQARTQLLGTFLHTYALNDKVLKVARFDAQTRFFKPHGEYSFDSSPRHLFQSVTLCQLF
jgi:hypothetical protein